MKKYCYLKINILISLALLLFTINAQAALPKVTSDGKPFPSLAPMIKEVHPAVVNIATYSEQRINQNPLLNDPFFRHFFNVPDNNWNNQPSRKRQQSAGSGVIIDARKGIIITNYHVIKNADEVTVSLSDRRSFNAEILGSDPELDIAVLKIKAGNLTEVQMANSNEIEVGDFVVAIGNPFGLGQTVTTGVVSALGRTGLGIQGYENFIQTDASINPGNSGGALVNMGGELVGINTAIIAPSGGNVGIGFAIPINMAKASMEQIVKTGEVERGQIGVSVQDITPDLQEAFDLKNGQSGVVVTEVYPDSPAEKAGIKIGDIIVEADEQEIHSHFQLRNQIGLKAIGEKVKLSLIRNNDKKRVSVRIKKPESFNDTRFAHAAFNGATLKNLPDKQGILIQKVDPRSPLARSGIRANDVIQAVNKTPVYDIKSLKTALSKNNKAVLLQVNRNGYSLYIYLK